MTQVLLCTRSVSINFTQNISQNEVETVSQIEIKQINEGTIQKTNHQVFNTKIKSSLCRNYMEKGFCPYGNKCQFAHGTGELKCNSDQHMSYKTRKCHAFIKQNYCSYGSRCNFLHQNQDIDQFGIYGVGIRDIIYQTRKKMGSRLLQILVFK